MMGVRFSIAPAVVMVVLALSSGARGVASDGAEVRQQGDAGGASALPAGTAEQVDRIARHVLAATGAPSASIALVKGASVVYQRAYGLARIEPDTPATPAMRYAIGSVSKQFTSSALLLLQQDGRLSLDDPVSKYLPSLTRAHEVTIRMLLTHTAGYRDYWPQDYVMLPMMQPTSTEHILEVWAKCPLDFDPGTKWQYSNTNYVIAARIIEIVTGRPYLETIEGRILRPLGLNSAIDVDTGRPIALGAQGYTRAAFGPLRQAPREGKGWMLGAFELAMTAGDLARWDISVMDRSLLKPASYDEMFTSAKLKDGTDTHYGLGVYTNPVDGHAAIEHTGEASGFVSDNIVFPAEHAAVVVLTNEMAVNAASRIGHGVVPLLLDDAALAASSSKPPPTQVEAQALAIFKGLQQGRIDRSLLTPNLDGYFDQQTLDDFASSLAPLGAPLSFHQIFEELRGGMTFRGFKGQFAGRNVRVTTYQMPDGKLEQYLVLPSE
ncbi:MAG TPA: serine hydrolase domain-containing protein [Acidisarcina sp.]